MPESMREQLEAAFDETDEEGEKGEGQEAGGSSEDTPESLGIAEAAAKEDESPKGEKDGPSEDEAAEKEKGEVKSPEPISAEAPPTGDEGGVGTGPSAPVSWKPTVRGHWDKLPSEVKSEITRREREMDQGLRQSSNYRKIAEEYYSTISPYQALIQAKGSTPSQAINELMMTAAQLTQGTPQKKAEVIRNIINEYGVDITMLDQILSGEDLPADTNAPLLAAMDQRLAPITDFMSQISGAREENAAVMNSEAGETLGTFAENNKYYEDLREDMADLLEMAANRNRPMTLEQAYEQAGAAHPEIGPIMKQQNDAKANKLTTEAAEKKLAAASSVRGSPTAGKGGVSEGTMRSIMEEAWDDNEGIVGH